MKKETVVDYLAVVGQAAEEEKAGRKDESILPEPAGEKVVDYLAVSEAWKENRGWMDNGKDE